MIADESTPNPSGFYNDGAIIKVDPATGAQTIFSNNSISANATGDTAFADPIGVTQAADGTILVAEAVQASAAAVIEVNPATGAQKVISSNVISGALNPPGAQAFVTPRSLVEEATGDILVANGDYDDPGHPSLIRVNRATGRQTVVSSGGRLYDFLQRCCPEAGRTERSSCWTGRRSGAPVRCSALRRTGPKRRWRRTSPSPAAWRSIRAEAAGRLGGHYPPKHNQGQEPGEANHEPDSHLQLQLGARCSLLLPARQEAAQALHEPEEGAAPEQR